jgi:hypothetical protein
MLTLCELPGPVSIRPPTSPQLKPYTFFTSRSRRPDGTERLYLHMGYFATLSEAQKWVQVMRRPYPNASPALAPATHLQRADSGVPTLTAAGAQAFAPVAGESLTDTQVMKILDRRVAPQELHAEDGKNADIALLRPEDTVVRRTLKEAVAQGAPVSFAVQLQWSSRPIDSSTLPALEIFKAHTLYTTESQRDGRSCYFLRLGFFTDTIAAREIGHQVRSSFPSSAVVPVTEQERARADGTRIDSSNLARPLKKRLEGVFNLDRVRAVATQWNSAARPTAQSTGTAPANGVPKSNAKSKTASSREESLEQTLETLARSETWGDADSLSETGVRHLSIAVEKRRR